MLNTLLESGARRSTPRRRLATVASLVAHTSLIVAAVAATASPKEGPFVPEVIKTVTFDPPPVKSPVVRSAPTTVPAAGVTPIAFPDAPVVIPDGIRAPDLSATATPDATEFMRARDTNAPDGEFTSPPTNAFESRFIDEPVIALPGSQAPRYPETLRAVGIQGEVAARFIVDTLGRTEPGSIVILGTSHDLFAASVRDALLRARYAPAKIRGQRVRQLVEQRFLFDIKP